MMNKLQPLPKIYESSEPEFIPTRSAGEPPEAFQTIVHKSYKPKSKAICTQTKNAPKKPISKDTSEAINLKRAKHEVFKLGMSGFSAQKKGEVKVQQAIKLGAKPPKNKNVNYKSLLEEKKQSKLKAKSETNLHQPQTTARKSKGNKISTKKTKTKLGKGGLLESYGKATAPVKPGKLKTKQK